MSFHLTFLDEEELILRFLFDGTEDASVELSILKSGSDNCSDCGDDEFSELTEESGRLSIL